MTTVKHKGKVRKWKGSIDKWEKHSEIIKEWCNGSDVEAFLPHAGEWIPVNNLKLFVSDEYRIAQPSPKHGAIYSDDDCSIYVYHNTEGKIRFPDVFYSEPNKYLAPSTAAYHARMFLERCDGKTDQETVAYLAEQCRYGE